MANLSNVTYIANGATTIFVLPFSYIEVTDITVTVDEVVKVLTTDYTFNGSGDVVFNVAPLNLEEVYISRDSDVTTRVTTYADGSNLTEEDLNSGGDQSIYLHQETRDQITTINTDNAAIIGRVDQHDIDIAANTADIVTNTAAIATNAADIVTNTADIATNASEILANTAKYFDGRIDVVGGVSKGDPLFISGSQGSQIQVQLADNTDFAKISVVALATEAGADAASISCQTHGLLEGIDTSAFTTGDIIYLSNGLLTNIHPSGIDAVIIIGYAVKINVSTGSIFIQVTMSTDANNHDGIVRHQIVNENTGTSASAAITVVNDAGHRVSMSLTGSNYSQVAGIADALVIYNEGYGKTVNAVDGNFGFEWWTDETDSHNLSSTAKMALAADGTLTVTGKIDIDHVATEVDDHAMEIDVNAAGFGDVKALDIDYITGAIVEGQDEAVILVNIDESLSTGGDVSALAVVATEGSAKTVAVLVGATVDPLEHLSGSFTDMDSALVNATSRLAEFISDVSDIEMFTADNDTITIGNTAKFEEIEFLLSTVSGRNIQPTFEYSTGVGTWATFTPIDGTNGMLNNGVIVWIDGDIPTWAVGLASEYLIRITRTRNGSITSPIESKVQIAVTTQYCWDKNADLKINSIDVLGDIEMQEIATPSTPATGFKKIYPKADGSVYTLDDTGTELVIGSSADAVTNVGASTDNAVAKFDSITGKIIQDSNVIIDDAGRISQTGLGTSTYLGILAGSNDDLTTNDNTGVGYDALGDVTTGTRNTGVGKNTLRKTTGVSNTGMGANAGSSMIFASRNTLGGDASGFSITTGNDNVNYGYAAGNTITTGDFNINIGSGVQSDSITGDNQLNIGDLIKGNTSTGDLDINSTTALGLPSGTEAQRPTGANGDIRYNSDSESFEGFQAGVWSSLGGSGGGLDTFYTENFEAGVGASNFTKGNNATYDNGGVFAGTLSDDVTTEINGVTSLKYVQASGSLNDWTKSPSISIFKKQQNNTSGAVINYTYDGAAGDIQVVLYDDTGSEVLTNSTQTFGSSTKSQRLTVQFPVGGSSVVLNWGIKVLVENIGAILVVDDVELTTNPFVSKDLLEITEWESFTPILTGFGAITSSVGRLRRVGDSMELEGSFISGVSTPVDAKLEIPLSESVDISKISGSNQDYLGLFFRVESISPFGATDNLGILFSDLSDANSVFFGRSASSNANLAKTDGTAIATTGHGMTFRLTVPIEGWQVSSDQIIAYNSRNAENSMVRLHTGDGHGSTNTKIRRFSTIVSDLGNDITYADSATDGASFTINEDGVYYMSYVDTKTTGLAVIGLSLNSSQLTTSVNSITEADKLSVMTTSAASFEGNVSWSGILSKGDIIRVHTDGLVDATSGTDTAHFTISKIGVGDLMGIPVPRTCYIKDVKASGTAGGTFTSGAWQTRDLNTVSGDTEFVSLATNQFTLQPGKYEIEAAPSAQGVNRHKSRLRNITDAVTELVGTNAYSGTTNISFDQSISKGVIEINTPKTFEVQHRCETTSAVGYGYAHSYGEVEVYTQIKITKVS